MKGKRTLFICTYVLSLFVLFLVIVIKPAKEFSENENRALAQAPKVSVENILDGTFQTSISNFLSDQIPFREFGIEISTLLKKISGKKEINNVYLGKDNYYFQRFTDESYSSSRMLSVFQMIEDFSQKQSSPVYIMMVPTPGTIYQEKLPKNAPFYDGNAVFNLAKDTFGTKFIDIRESFLHTANEQQLYYKTDHHWTAYGAYEAYLEYCKLQNISAKELEYFQLQEVSDSFYGTIYSKVLDYSTKPDSILVPQNLPEVKVTYDDEKVSDSLYQMEYAEKKDKYALFFGGNWGKVRIETQSKNNKRLLIIKDSFANSFVPYILEDFQEIIMLDLRYYKDSVDTVLEEHEVTDILFLYETSNLLTDTGIINLAK